MRSCIVLAGGLTRSVAAAWLKWSDGGAPTFLPQETDHIANPIQVGWTPKPTPAPGFKSDGDIVLAILQRQDSSTSANWTNTETCGWFAGVSSSAFTCGGNFTCTTNGDHIVGCKSETFAQLFSVCLDFSAAQEGSCDNLGPRTGCCSRSSLPACGTFLWTGKPERSLYTCLEEPQVVSLLDEPQFVIDASEFSRTHTPSTTSPAPSATTAREPPPGASADPASATVIQPGVSRNDGDANNGALIGGAVGGAIAGILLLSLLIYYLLRRKCKLGLSLSKITNKKSKIHDQPEKIMTNKTITNNERHIRNERTIENTTNNVERHNTNSRRNEGGVNQSATNPFISRGRQPASSPENHGNVHTFQGAPSQPHNATKGFFSSLLSRHTSPPPQNSQRRSSRQPSPIHLVRNKKPGSHRTSNESEYAGSQSSNLPLRRDTPSPRNVSYGQKSSYRSSNPLDDVPTVSPTHNQRAYAEEQRRHHHYPQRQRSHHHREDHELQQLESQHPTTEDESHGCANHPEHYHPVCPYHDVCKDYHDLVCQSKRTNHSRSRSPPQPQ